MADPQRPTFRYLASDTSGESVESYLLHKANLGPRAALKRAFSDRAVFLNGKPAKRSDSVQTGDVIEVQSQDIQPRGDWKVVPNANASLRILRETPELLAVFKPAGMNAHPQRTREDDTALNYLVATHPEVALAANTERPLEGLLLHRLDRGTSGVLCLARSAKAWRALREVWQSRDIEKYYLAWVEGELRGEGRIECVLGHDPKSKKRMIVRKKNTADRPTEKLWDAVTSYRSLATHQNHTLVLIRIHTGVTHQIRATLAALGHPVLGDPIYKRTNRPPLVDQRSLSLDHDTARGFEQLLERLVFKAEIPAPRLEDLPNEAFFLHALWLKANKHPALREGILAPVPDYFYPA